MSHRLDTEASGEQEQAVGASRGRTGDAAHAAASPGGTSRARHRPSGRSGPRVGRGPKRAAARSAAEPTSRGPAACPAPRTRPRATPDQGPAAEDRARSGSGPPSASSRSCCRSSPPDSCSCRGSTRTTTPRSLSPRARRRSLSRRRVRRSTTATGSRSHGPSTRRSSSPTRPTRTRTPPDREYPAPRLGVDYIDAVCEAAQDVDTLRRAGPTPESGAGRCRGPADPAAATRACTSTRTPCGSTPGNVAANLIGFVDDEGHGGAGFESSTGLPAVGCQRIRDVRDGRRAAAPARRQHDRRARRGHRCPAHDRPRPAVPGAEPAGAGGPAGGGALGLRRHPGRQDRSDPRARRRPDLRPEPVRAVLARHLRVGGAAGRLRAGQRREGADVRLADRRRLRDTARAICGPDASAARRCHDPRLLVPPDDPPHGDRRVAQSSNIATVLASAEMPHGQLHDYLR